MDGGRNFNCVKCGGIVEGGMRGFQQHLRRSDHPAPFTCGQDNCHSEFMERKSLYTHIRDYHLIAPLVVVEPVAHPENVAGLNSSFADYPMNVTGAAMGEDPHDARQFEEMEDDEREEEQLQEPPPDVRPPDGTAVLKRSAELSVLGLRSVTYMTSTAIQSFENQAFTLMQDTASYLREKVIEYFSNPNRAAGGVEELLNQFALDNPFNHLKTKEQQMKVFIEKYQMIKPDTKYLGQRFDSRLRQGRTNLQPAQLAKSFQYVSITKILESIMSDPYLRKLILSEKPSDDEYMRSFLDGSLYETLPDDLKGAVRIVLYVDDLELLQALSAMQGKYKMTGFYFGIQNLPPELNALLTFIFVAALAFAEDAKDEEVWEPLLKELQRLETEGATIMVDGQPFTFKAVLVSFIGDTAAAHEVLGFKSPSASRFCRRCYIKRTDFWQDGLAVGELRTPERLAADVEAAARSAASSKASGVDKMSKLVGLRFFQSSSHGVFDVFHDLLQGICKMEVKLALREYVCVKKYFTEDQLMSRVKFFDYGYPDKLNKPVPKIKAKYLNNIKSYNLHQTGAQVWCLTRAFGFLFGDLVPQDDKFMTLIALLNQIMSIVFSRAICETDLVNLQNVIIEHHTLFKEIFPGCVQQPQPEGNQNVDDVDEQDIAAEELFHDVYGDIDEELMGAGGVDSEQQVGINVEPSGDQEEGISGRHLSRLTDDDLKGIGLNTGVRMDLLDLCRNYTEAPAPSWRESFPRTSSFDAVLQSIASVESDTTENIPPIVIPESNSAASTSTINNNVATIGTNVRPLQVSNISNISCGQHSQAHPLNMQLTTESSAASSTSSQASRHQTVYHRPVTSLSRSNNVNQGVSLPPESDPSFFSALNSEARVQRIVADGLKNLNVDYDVRQIISDGKDGQSILSSLDKTGYVDSPAQKRMANILTTYLFNSVAHPAAVSTHMREAVAIKVVSVWPKLAMPLHKKSDKPWHLWYNPSENMGHLAHSLAGKQRLMKRETGEGFRKSSKPSKVPRVLIECSQYVEDPDDPDPESYHQDITEAKNLQPTQGEKQNILHLMRKTHDRRRHELKNKSICTLRILRKFPQLLSYNGEVINQEFTLMYSGRQSNFLRIFPTEFMPRLFALAEKQKDKYSSCSSTFGYEVLNALMILGRFLPTPRRTYTHEKDAPLHPAPLDLFHIVPPGSDPEREAAARLTAPYPVQPYILAIGHPQNVNKMFLVVGDGKMLQLHDTATPINAMDLLFKTYLCFNLHFPLGWKNVWRFVHLHIFHIPPENPRESRFNTQLMALRAIDII